MDDFSIFSLLQSGDLINIYSIITNHLSDFQTLILLNPNSIINPNFINHTLSINPSLKHTNSKNSNLENPNLINPSFKHTDSKNPSLKDTKSKNSNSENPNLINPNTKYSILKHTNSKNPNVKETSSEMVRPLAKKYISFLNRALTLIPNRLAKESKISNENAIDLLKCYDLCIECLGIICSEIDTKPYMVHYQRLRLLKCYKEWGMFNEGEKEGFRVLEGLNGKKSKSKFVPILGKNCKIDKKDENLRNLGLLLVDIVGVIVKCVYYKGNKKENDYRNILILVNEVSPWLRILDASAFEMFHNGLVTYMCKFTIRLVGELSSTNKDLVCDFLLVMFSELRKSSFKDQLLKYAYGVCSSLFSSKDCQSCLIMHILSCVLDIFAVECKAENESSIIELLKLASYCANKCRIATQHLCIGLATHIKKLAGELHQVDLILRLYSTGLFLTDSCSQQGQTNTTSIKKDTNSESKFRSLCSKDETLHDLSVLLGRLRIPFSVSKTDSLPTIDTCNNSVSQMYSGMLSFTGVCKVKNIKQVLLLFYEAMKFVCQPLADVVNSAPNKLFAQVEGAGPPTVLCTIRDASLQFCDVFLYCHSALDKESISSDDYNRTMSAVAVAALKLSFRTNSYIKESVKIIKQVISADWILANPLKFLCSLVYNFGVTLFRSNQLKEAAMAMKLCCRAAWACVSHLSKTFFHESSKSSNDVPEDDIFINEACAKSAFLLDLLNQCNDHSKSIEVVRSSLLKWSAAADVFERLPSPSALVKQWVKIECKLFKDPDTNGSAVSLYSLLSSCTSVSLRSLSVIMEQELSSYDEVRTLNLQLCHKMRMDIIDVLLAKVYVGDDSCFQRVKILITKGREMRASGVEGLKSCIECLSEAILLLDKSGVNNQRVVLPIATRHQLAVAYALRALCIQEAEPNNKSLFEDIRAAINLWRSPGCSTDDLCDMAYENVLIILYHVIDMLSLKGYTVHSDIYELLITFAKKKMPFAKCLRLLWQCRRLSHALCPSPLDEASISTLSQLYEKPSHAMEFWKNCLCGSLPLEMGFWQRFFFMFTNISCGESHIGGVNVSRSKLHDLELEQAASNLASSVPLSSDSAFIAAHLYYDLSERRICYGRLSEALSFAKEANLLRLKLLQEKFKYSISKLSKGYDETGATVQKCLYTYDYCQIHNSVATAAWPQDKKLFNLEGTVLTPWNVLQCHLESTLQVGIIHELMGDGSEAESFLVMGKSLANLMGLPVFELAFSSVLGRVYHKQQLWHDAEQELKSAKDQAEKEFQSAEILKTSYIAISCSKCRLLMVFTINLELGDLFRSRRDNDTANLYVKRLREAETLYRSAIGKVNCWEWKNPVSNPEEPRDGNLKPKRSRKTKNSAKPLQCRQNSTAMQKQNQIMTRSKCRSLTNNDNTHCEEAQVVLTEHTNNEQRLAFADSLDQKGTNSSLMDFGTEMSCICNKNKCWHCLPAEVMQSESLKDFVLMKWEFARRKLYLKLLSGLGDCMDALAQEEEFKDDWGETHESHELLMQSICVLVGRNSFSAPSSVHLTFLLDLIGNDIPEDAFTIEHAELLFNICWFSLKSYRGKGPRISCCDMANIQIPKIVSWLMLSFVLSREVPVLFQKVSRLLAVVFVLSSSTELFSRPITLCKPLSESKWAFYFHQASIGTHFNHQVFSSGKGCRLNDSRLVPEKFKDLEKQVESFFHDFPCVTIIGISLLGGSFASLLSKILKHSAHAWLFLSRITSHGQPVALLYPVDSILEETSDDDTNLCSGVLFEDDEVIKRWHSPSGSTVVDEVAPVFKLMLKKSYLSTNVRPKEDTNRNRLLWWNQRKDLDKQLEKFTRDIEDLWLGPSKYLLMGEWSGCDNREAVLKKLAPHLEAKYKVEAHESLLKAISGGSNLALLREKCILQLTQGWLISKGEKNEGSLGGGMDKQQSHKTLADSCDGVENLSDKVLKLLLEATMEVEEEDLNREPVILVLDYDIQMLPWESLPILRKQEVYRMPSVCSIFATLGRCHQFQVGAEPSAFPMIDPLDAFYVLNPDGDLIHTQTEFEDWFRVQNLEGKAGISPTVDELKLALSNRDLYIYLGHGSGAQYITGREIQKLENCAATVLMGCSSGSLSLEGCYTPKGAPLSYLLAGSPVIIANLWDVTDKDIDRFGKSILDNWLRERAAASVDCIQCKKNFTGNKGNTKKKTSRNFCNHRPKIGSFVAQARDACQLPFLIGAAPVCYGVPTHISKKKVENHQCW